MNKIETLQGSDWLPPQNHPSYTHETLDGGAERLFGCIPSGDPSVFSKVVQSLAPPYSLLYVLHTPRGEAEAGRYQSEELSPQQLTDLIARHEPFLGKV